MSSGDTLPGSPNPVFSMNSGSARGVIQRTRAEAGDMRGGAWRPRTPGSSEPGEISPRPATRSGLRTV